LFENDAQAAEALAAANNDVVAPVVEAPVEQAPAESQPNTVDAGTNQASESFTNIDINSLPEELRPIAEAKLKEFQADYTRKTQEIAPVRQLMQETGLSAEEARQALDFVQGLNDPSNLRQLYETLSEQFGQQEVEDEGDESVDPRDQQLQTLETRLARFEQQQAMAEAKGQLDSAISSVKSAHADWTDADLNRVQSLAVSHMQNMGPRADLGRAMAAAAEDYAAWRQETINAYIANKGTVQTGATPALGQTTHAETPAQPFANLDEATKAALARFGNAI
jgi:hypothetical protein